ncbi:hypothetical protein BV210_03445 [Halorientalis sp. IM1011]|uniref:hypothetical protein n=1 Tax=Halorientalis sp. IM1011 TaxID=1932360 RepID=UPI00097CC226|nr:hypothetical protein [Halorientalis sp. IM1011]AQL41826.1 hypothetical protein BV210_03445 [Halorientalis sp. IM1011]
MSVRRWSRIAARIGACLLVASVVAVFAAPGPVGPATAQETANGTAADGAGNGSQLQTAANADGDEGGGGLLSGLFGLVGGVVGFFGGIVGAILGFLDSPIGHALVGIPLGLYLGLKAIALYLEYYE